ncbi:MAG: hypothetical protein ABR985_21700 [Methanotrichaceae archaeon]|jgi:non-homologous end joining protein Ku
MRYKNEVKDNIPFCGDKGLPKADEKELALMTITDKNNDDLDLRVYKDGYKERMEALIKERLRRGRRVAKHDGGTE